MAINGCVGGGGGLWRWWLLWFNIFFFLAMGFDFEMGIDCDGGG